MNDLVETVNKIVKDRRKSVAVVEALLDQGIIIVRHGDKAIDTIVDTFKKQFGTTSASRYDRFAAKRLAERHGTDGVCKVIELLRQYQSEQYCPTIGSIQQLEQKWVSVGRFLGNLASSDSDIDV